jgi:hypothetical protein
LCYAEPVVVNHGVQYWTSGCESQPLAQHSTTWFKTSCSV